MKKFPVLALIALLLVLAASVAFAATEPFNCPNCGGVGTGVVSSYIEYPTCVKGGTFSMFCNSCKTSYVWSGDNIDPDAHDMVFVSVNPTCTLNGGQGKRCTLCGTWADDATILPATGHKWGGWSYNGTAGQHTRSCRNTGCDATETEGCNFDTYQYHNLGGGVLKHGHMCLDCLRWVDHESSGGTATCTEKPVCWCGLTYGSALGHNPGNPVETPATCTADGKIEQKCMRCHVVLSSSVIDKTGHQWGGWSYSGTPGTHTHSCRNTGCSASENASCNYDNYGYRDYRGGVEHGHMCLDCWNWVDHTASGGTASCVAKAVCWCGLSYGELGDHVPGAPVETPATCTTDGKKETKCTVCQAVLSTETIGKTGHNTKLTGTTAATCTQEGVETYTCQNNGCSYTETKTSPALGHTYVELWQVGDSDTHYRNCYRCGAGRKIVECTYLPLVIDEVQYQVCPVCGRFQGQKLEAVTDATITLAAGSKPGASLVRMLAQPFGADDARYPVILTAIFEAEGLIAEPAANVSGITVSVPMSTSAAFKLVYVHADDVTGQLIWTDVPCTLANGVLSFTVEEMGLFLFVAE